MTEGTEDISCLIDERALPLSDCHVLGRNGIKTTYTALWDTGASGCAIHPRVAADCGLVREKMNARVTRIDGTVAPADTTVVDFELPNGVTVRDERVAVQPTPPVCDIVIGMSIILRGDLVVANLDGQMRFTFRYRG